MQPPERWRAWLGSLLVDKLARDSVVGVGPGGGRVVGGDGQAVARRLGKADASRDDGLEDELAEMAPHLGGHISREPGAPVHHRQEHPRERKLRIEARAYELDGVEELREPLERVVLALHGHEHAIRGRKTVDRQRPQGGRAVDEDVGVRLARGRQSAGKEGLAVAVR